MVKSYQADLSIDNYYILRRYLLRNSMLIKFIHSEKAAEFCEISTLLLTTVHTVKSKMEISQNFVAFSEYMNFTLQIPLALFS